MLTLTPRYIRGYGLEDHECVCALQLDSVMGHEMGDHCSWTLFSVLLSCLSLSKMSCRKSSSLFIITFSSYCILYLH